MFNNIGNKIKTLASVMAWIGIIVSIIGGIVLIGMGISQLDSYYSRDMATAMIISGFITAALGALFSWIGSFLLYGFGELVDCARFLAGRSSDAPKTPHSYTQSPQNYTQTPQDPAQERINKLNDLYRQGLITEEEYQRKQAEL